MSDARPTLVDSFNDNTFVDKREKPEKLSSKKRILYEIENLLDMQEKNLKLDVIDSRSRHDKRIPNRDLYKIYKCLTDTLDVRPRMVYTGRDVLDFDEAKSIVEENSEDLTELEPTL